MKDKLRLIYIPYLITFVGLITIYTFLHWLIIVNLELFEIKEIIVNFGIPFVLSAVFAFFIIRPRLKILNLHKGVRDLVDLYAIMVLFSLFVPLMIAQNYIDTATGVYTTIENIEDINNEKLSKYYIPKNHFEDKESAGYLIKSEVGGRNNENLSFSVYIAIPMYNNNRFVAGKEPQVWLAKRYSKRISNRLDTKTKEARFNDFMIFVENKFRNEDLSNFRYLERLTNSDDKDKYITAIRNSPVYKSNQLIVIGENELLKDKSSSYLKWFIGVSIIGSLIFLIMISIPSLNEEKVEDIKKNKSQHSILRELRDFFDILLPSKDFFITPILIDINIVVYLAMVIFGCGFISFEVEDLIKWGANEGYLTLNGEWWRLLTSTFIHANLMHIITNMFALIFVGMFLEPLLGRTKFLISYLLTGILASLTSVLYNENVVSVGASGAIFGLYGIFTALLITKIYSRDFSKPLLISIAVFVGFNLLMGLAGSGIDNAAHIGGFVSGFLLGFMLYPNIKSDLENTDYDE